MPTISRILPQHGVYRADFPALDFDGRTWRYAELNDLVNTLANALRAAGLKKGDRFATVLPNSLELMAAYWAAAVSGLVIVPCSVLLQAGGLRTLLQDAAARLVICSDDQVDNLVAIRQDLPDLLPAGYVLTGCKTVEGFVAYDDFLSDSDTTDPAVLVEPDDVYNIMYSSGTTGLPKGIIHTHRIRSMYCTLFANAWRMTPESVCLHAGAIVFNGAMLDLMPWMFLGCRYILHESLRSGRRDRGYRALRASPTW